MQLSRHQNIFKCWHSTKCWIFFCFLETVYIHTNYSQTSAVKAGPPLEAILVIFGRRALIFFLFESSWKKMKNDATFVRMRSGDHLGDAKMSKKGTSLRRI